MTRLIAVAVITLGLLVGCGGSKPTREQLAMQCGQKAANSLTPGFGGAERKQLQQAAAKAAAEFYLQNGHCTA